MEQKMPTMTEFKQKSNERFFQQAMKGKIIYADGELIFQIGTGKNSIQILKGIKGDYIRIEYNPKTKRVEKKHIGVVFNNAIKEELKYIRDVVTHKIER